MTNQPTASGVSEEMVTAACLEAKKRSGRNIGAATMRHALEAALSAKPAQGGDIAEWEKLRDPVVLHINLLRGFPATLSKEQLLHLLGDQAPQPIPTPDEALRHREILWDCRNKAKGHETNRTALTENGEKYLREDIALAAMSRVAAHASSRKEWDWPGELRRLDREAALSRARPEEAIREAALEEAAKVVDDMAARYKADWDRFTLHDSKRALARADQGVTTSKRIAGLLRALKSKSAHSPAPRVEEKESGC